MCIMVYLEEPYYYHLTQKSIFCGGRNINFAYVQKHGFTMIRVQKQMWCCGNSMLPSPKNMTRLEYFLRSIKVYWMVLAKNVKILWFLLCTYPKHHSNIRVFCKSTMNTQVQLCFTLMCEIYSFLLWISHPGTLLML